MIFFFFILNCENFLCGLKDFNNMHGDSQQDQIRYLKSDVASDNCFPSLHLLAKYMDIP